jgi:hypothetical protein
MTVALSDLQRMRLRMYGRQIEEMLDRVGELAPAHCVALRAACLACVAAAPAVRMCCRGAIPVVDELAYHLLTTAFDSVPELPADLRDWIEVIIGKIEATNPIDDDIRY